MPESRKRVFAKTVVRLDPCSYCFGPGGTLDHIKPKADGGTYGWTNLTSACKECNNARGKLKPLLFLGRLHGRLKLRRAHHNKHAELRFALADKLRAALCA